MRKHKTVSLLGLLLTVPVGLAVLTCTQPQRPRGSTIHSHTNPPVVLGPGASPHKWKYDSNPLDFDPTKKIFQGSACASNLAVLPKEVVGTGTDSLDAIYANTKRVVATENWFAVRSKNNGQGNNWLLEFRLQRTGNEYRMTHVSGSPTCTLTMGTQECASNTKCLPHEFRHLEPPGTGSNAHVLHDRDGDKTYEDDEKIKFRADEDFFLEFTVYKDP